MPTFVPDFIPTIQGSNAGITRAWLLYPDRKLATLMDRFIDFEMDLEAWLSGTIRVKMPASHRMFGLSWQGVPILERLMENWGCNFYYRDPGDGSRKKFIGIVDPVTVRHRGVRGTAYVEMEFNHAFWELLKRRQVWTQKGERYFFEGSPDNACRDVIRKQTTAGFVVTPDDFPGDRTHFGPAEARWTVSCEGPADPPQHPESFKFYVTHGTVLTDVVRELFQGRMPTTGTPTDIHPELREDTPGAFHISILCGKDVVTPRVIGRDLAVTKDLGGYGGPKTVLSPERKTILSFAQKTERTDQMTAIEVKGQGEHLQQARFYIVDDNMEARVGIIENAWTAPDALDPDELEFEARSYLAKRSAGTTSTEVELIEQVGRFEYPEHIDLMDTVVVYSGNGELFNIMQNLDVVKVKVTIPVPGYQKVAIGLGQLERNFLAEMGRHAGGRGGGGGGGGRPRGKTGSGTGTGGKGACDKAIICIQDDASEECVDDCEGKIKFIGDPWIDATVRKPAPGDPGPGDTDVVVKLQWCLPECPDGPPPGGPVLKYGLVCLSKADGSSGQYLVELKECAGTPMDAAPEQNNPPDMHRPPSQDP